MHRTPKHHPLSHALALVLLASPLAATAAQLIVTDGTTQPADNGTYDTGTSTGTAGVALGTQGAASKITGSNVTATSGGRAVATILALDGGEVDLDAATVKATGLSSAAVQAEGTNSLIRLSNSSVSVTNANSDAVLARGAGRVELRGGVATSAQRSALLSSGAGSDIHADGVALSSQSASQEVVRAEDGGAITLTGRTVDAVGAGSVGLFSVAGGSTIEATDVAITTVGSDGGIGVLAVDGGSVALHQGTITTKGTKSAGIQVEGAGSRVTADGTDIATKAKDSHGVMVMDGATARLDDAAITTTLGAGLAAVGVGSAIDAANSKIAANGAGISAIAAEQGAHVTLSQGTKVAATGDSSNGLRASGIGSLITADATEVKASGQPAAQAGANGIAVADGATVRVVNGSLIEASGTGPGANAAVAVGQAQNNGTPVASTLEISDSKLISQHQVGVGLVGGAMASLTNTQVDAGTHALAFDLGTGTSRFDVSGGALHSGDASIFAQAGNGVVNLSDSASVTSDRNLLALVYSTATLALNLDSVQATGDLHANPAGYLDVALANGSSLSGKATNGRAFAIDGTSTWNLTGVSDVRSVALAGTVAFAAPTAADFKTLTVKGDYTANDGKMVLNTALGDDASQTDKLIVQGNTTGNTSLQVNNAGGTGAYTTGDGIQVVQVNGASNGVFALDGRVVAGANEYLLAQGGKANPADGDWYLRSEAPPAAPVDPATPADPIAPTDPTPVAPDPTPISPVAPQPSAPLYRPEPAAYLANQAASVGMFEHSMHDRMGEANLGQRGDDDRTSAAWVRVVRNQMDGTTGEGQLDAGTDVSVLQIGGEIARWNDDSRFHLGLMGGTGRADTEATSSLLDWRSKGKVIGYNLGVYGTWFADATAATGLYLDGWLQYGRYDNKVQGDYLAEERYNASTWSASMEAGYAFALNDGGNTRFFIEPQAQAIFTDYSASQHRESNGTRVDDVEAGGLTTRVGVRLYGHAANTQQNVVQPFVTLNWWHDNDRNAMSFNDTTLELQWPRDRYETKLGLQAQLGGGWMGWGNLGLVYGARDYRDVTGQLGLNYRW